MLYPFSPMLARVLPAPERLRLAQERLLPHGWIDVLFQTSLFVAYYMLYSVIRGFAEVNSALAFANARDVIHIERVLHIFVEPQIQAWAMGSHAVMDVASWLYLNAQTTVTIAAIVYVYFKHNDRFYLLRNMLGIAMTIALVVYAVFPTAPPRFLPEWGFTDSVAAFTGVQVEHASASMSALVNPYAAVPSMHVAFALIIASQVIRLTRSKALKVATALYPLLITFVIIATANHFIVDAVLGALTALISIGAAYRLANFGPFAWRLTAAPATARG